MDLAPLIEHTLLRADATPADAVAHCREAISHGFYGVCVSPCYVGLARRELLGTEVRLITVAGFPLGTATSGGKATEARAAVHQGADEIDAVLPIGLALGGDWVGVAMELRALRRAADGADLKIILETGYWDEEGLRRVAEAALEAGADFLKTSSGFGPRGATVRDVELLVGIAGDRAKVKASGGIRTREMATALVRAGAARLGTSASIELVSSATPRSN